MTDSQAWQSHWDPKCDNREEKEGTQRKGVREQQERVTGVLDLRGFTCMCVCGGTVKCSGKEFPPVQVKQQQGWPPILGHYI